MSAPLATTIDPDALKYVLSLPKGRAVLWDILAACGLYRSAFNPDGPTKDFNLGMQNAALVIYADCLTVSPDLTAVMIREQGTYDNGAGTDQPADRPEPADASGDDDTGLGFTRFERPTDLGGN